jgi:hypothetical protein
MSDEQGEAVLLKVDKEQCEAVEIVIVDRSRSISILVVLVIAAQISSD